MQILSATQAIGPAWNHTRDLLLRPRRWQLLLKIGAVALLAQLGGGSFNLSIPNGGHHSGTSPAIAGMLLAFTLLFVFLGLSIGLALLYVGSRFQFVLFDVVLRRDTKVGPIWTRFGGVTWRWIGLKLLLILAASVVLAILAVPFIFAFIKVFHGTRHSNFMSYLPLILAAVGVGLIWLIAFLTCFFLLVDFGLPSIALEGTPIREAARRAFALLRLETGPVLLYLLLRVGLGFAGTIIAEFGIAICALVALIPFGGVAYGLWLALHNAGIVGKVFMGLGFGVLGVIFLALLLIAATIVLGYLYTFLQAYAMYFLAGRYPLMGEMLDRYTPPGFWPTLTPGSYPLPPSPLSTPEHR